MTGLLTDNNGELHLFAEMEFPISPVNTWSGLGEITLDGITYRGVGDFLTINLDKHDRNLSLPGCTIDLVADMTWENIAFASQFEGAPVTVGIILDRTTRYVLFAGRGDYMRIRHSAYQTHVLFHVESELARLERVAPRRMTQASHETRFPGDLAFQHVDAIRDTILVWGEDA